MTLFFQNPTPPERVLARHITLLALMMRLTRAERDAIRAAETTDGDVSDIMFLLSKARYIDLGRTDTIASMNALEAKTLLSAGRATAILSAEVQETERP